MTEQRKRFADRYFDTLNGTQSAIYAGYSETTAKVQASQLLSDPEVEAYISGLKAKAEEKHGITKDRWMSELENIGFSNIQDFIETGNTIKDISQIDSNKARAVLSVKKTVTESEYGSKEVVEFKLHDKLNALDKIGRHLGYFEKDNEQSKTAATVTIFQLPDNGRG